MVLGEVKGIVIKEWYIKFFFFGMNEKEVFK